MKQKQAKKDTKFSQKFMDSSKNIINSICMKSLI